MLQWRGRLTKDQQKLNIQIKQQQTELVIFWMMVFKQNEKKHVVNKQ